MDIKDLKVFLAVADHLNFTKAGREVHLSQPSVSVRIKQLEYEFGVKLFEQFGKKVTLTEAGRLLVPYALRVVAAMDDARHAIDEFQGIERGSLRIGASTTPGMYLLPKIISKFKSLYPKIEVRMTIRNTREVEEAILKDEFDLGFVGGHLVTGQVEVLPWHMDMILLVAPPDHPLARRKKISAEDLARERFVVREAGSATRSIIENRLRELDVQTLDSVELGNPEAVKQAVKSGLGIAFISRLAVEAELKSKALIAIGAKEFASRREMKIVYRKERHLSRAALALIEKARQVSD
jgi:DNA-binding transcriptional LysR family regulator